MIVKAIQYTFVGAALLAGLACQGATENQQVTENAGPETAPAPAHAEAPTLSDNTATGVVVETFDAATYTYVRVDTGDEEIWAAASQFKVAVGDRVTVPLEMPMQDFHSSSLDRDFSLIYFTSAVFPADQTSGGSGSSMAQSHGSHAPPAVKPSTMANAAPGGLTISELWQRREELSGTTVVVRGTVVKYNAGILDRNWLHIQDGSGDPQSGTHDLTVTTNSTAQVDQVVVATGTVTLNQDFGSGYAYDLMLSDAKVAAQ